ncbi:MAG TPA: hypothetical protein DD611_00835 [Alphaproteobacteria bacterium]|nr:hypothetical protein [Alphaproteobacteria bacterium]
MKMCANGALLYLLDCFVTLAMTDILEFLSLRASVATRGNPVYFMLRAAHKIFITTECQRRRMNFFSVAIGKNSVIMRDVRVVSSVG